MQSLDATTVEALRTVVREEALPELRGEALEVARRELAEELAKGLERLGDQMAAYKESVDHEVERRVEAGVRRELEEVKADYEDQIRDLTRARTLARQQRDAAEGQLLHLLQQLLGEEGRYLRNAYVEEFDQFTVNQVLKRHGWRVRSKATYSERTVKTRLDQARWQARAVFWLDTVPGEGVEDPDADEAAPEERPDRLALTEGQLPEET